MNREMVLNHFGEFVREHQLFRKGEQLLVAVSGGADSMVLCDLLLRSKASFSIAHCNFRLRDSDSERDELFVRNYAAQKKIEIFVKTFETREYADENRWSIEEAARNLRYNWFEEIREENNFSWIATAHHKNDDAETLLLNLCRGTGIRGLHGIRPKHGKIIRPLLFLTKKEIRDYVTLHRLDNVEDVTNQSNEYERNYLRNEVVPVLERRYPDWIERMSENKNRFKEAEMLYDQALETHFKNLMEPKGDEIFISVRKLKKSQPLNTVAFELFKNYGFTWGQTLQILGLLDKESGKVINAPGWRLLKDRKHLILSPIAEEKEVRKQILESESKVRFANGQLSFEKIDLKKMRLSKLKEVAYLDADKVIYPLTLRKWEPGDYFYPLGMKKKKKLGRFFIDQKLSLNEKDKIWVLCSGKKMIWVIGQRIDDRFKISPQTCRVLKISLK